MYGGLKIEGTCLEVIHIYIYIYVSDFSDTGDFFLGGCRKEASMCCRKIAHTWMFFHDKTVNTLFIHDCTLP